MGWWFEYVDCSSAVVYEDNDRTMVAEKCIEIVGGNTRNETIELGNHEQSDSIYGGAFLVNCEVNICGSNFKIADANFLNCKIHVREPISNVQFLESVFERSVLTGKFIRCSFGFRRGVSQSPNAYYRNCDFSSAILDACCFFTGDTETVSWPKWPTITVLNPRQNENDWKSILFPDELKAIRSELFNNELLSESSNADNAPLAMTFDVSRYTLTAQEASLEAIRTLFRAKSYIHS